MSGIGKAVALVAGIVIGLALVRGVASGAVYGQSAEEGWDMHVANMHDLYGVDVLLTYDASVVEVVDTDLDRPGVQIEPGPLFTGQP